MFVVLGLCHESWVGGCSVVIPSGMKEIIIPIECLILTCCLIPLTVSSAVSLLCFYALKLVQHPSVWTLYYASLLNIGLNNIVWSTDLWMWWWLSVPWISTRKFPASEVHRKATRHRCNGWLCFFLPLFPSFLLFYLPSFLSFSSLSLSSLLLSSLSFSHLFFSRRRVVFKWELSSPLLLPLRLCSVHILVCILFSSSLLLYCNWNGKVTLDINH